MYVGMRQLNMPISDEAHMVAKVAAARKGILLRQWVQDALIKQAGTESHDWRQLAEPKPQSARIVAARSALAERTWPAK